MRSLSLFFFFFFIKGFLTIVFSSLLLFPQRFGRDVLQPSSGVCQTREPTLFRLRSSMFHVGSRVQQTLEVWRTYQLKRCGNNNKDDNSLKTLNDKNHQISQKFRQLLSTSVIQ